MSREIKFRQYVWKDDSKQEGKMFSWEDLLNDLEESLGCLFTTKFSNASELMQFTGLYDKNGKEIYEGDIVKFECETFPEVALTGKYIIEYATTSFVGINQEDETLELHFGRWFLDTEEGKNALEIIGNIYE